MWERTRTYVRTYSPWTGVYDSTHDGRNIDDNFVCRIHTHVRHDLREFGVWSSPRFILFVNRNNDNHRNYLRVTKEKRKKNKIRKSQNFAVFLVKQFSFSFLFFFLFFFFIFTQYETKRNSHDHAISRRRIISFFRVDNTKTEIHTISITNRKVSLCFVE